MTCNCGWPGACGDPASGGGAPSTTLDALAGRGPRARGGDDRQRRPQGLQPRGPGAVDARPAARLRTVRAAMGLRQLAAARARHASRAGAARLPHRRPLLPARPRRRDGQDALQGGAADRGGARVARRLHDTRRRAPRRRRRDRSRHRRALLRAGAAGRRHLQRLAAARGRQALRDERGRRHERRQGGPGLRAAGGEPPRGLHAQLAGGRLRPAADPGGRDALRRAASRAYSGSSCFGSGSQRLARKPTA